MCKTRLVFCSRSQDFFPAIGQKWGVLGEDMSAGQRNKADHPVPTVGQERGSALHSPLHGIHGAAVNLEREAG